MHPGRGGYSVAERSELQVHTTPVNLQELCRQKELSPPSYTQYDSVHITFLKRQNYRSRGQFRGCQGLKRGWDGKEVRGQPKWYPRLVLLQEGGSLPGPETGLLSNTRK